MNEMAKPRVVKPRPPSKTAYDKSMTEIAATIDHLQKSLKKIKAEIHAVTEQLKRLRDEKNGCYKEKEGIESHIRAMSADINKMTETHSNLRSKIPYRDERRLDDTIKKLQRTQQNSNLKMSEEKKIVAEIDSLTRSKKFIRQFHEVGAELKERKAAQQREREARERCLKRISLIRKDEEASKMRRDSLSEQEVEVKTELEQQYALRTDVQSEYNRQQAEYQRRKAEVAEAKQAEVDRIRQERREAAQADRQEVGTVQPYHEERNLCTLLTNHLRSLQTSSEIHNMSAKQARKMGKKSLVHNPVVLNQFLKLDLVPPSVFDKIPESLTQLETKLQHFLHLASTPSSEQTDQTLPEETDSLDQHESIETPRSEIDDQESFELELEAPQSPNSPDFFPGLPLFHKKSKSDQDSVTSSTEFVGLAELMMESWLDEKMLLDDKNEDSSSHDEVRVVS